MTRQVSFFLVLLAFGLSTSQAQDCLESYTVRPGDTLSGIARQVYEDAAKWSVIYQANIQVIGYDPHLIRIGQEFRVPCLDQQGTATEAVWTAGEGKEVQLLTANDYKPFTDESLPGGGLVTELVDAAMQANEDIPSAGIVWHDDWSEHLDPLLMEHRYDMGFPWLRPDCEQNPDAFRCSNFLFSEPVFEMLVLLFTDRERPLRFTEDGDIIGKTLCRPDGYYTHDLDKDGRYWLAEGKITLKQPKQVSDCFDMLLAGEVDAVALNEFTGRSTINSMGIEDRIDIIDTRPLSIEGLHVLVARSHPEAGTLIAEVNDGLDMLKQAGEYQAIVDRHLSEFWAQF